MLDILIRGGRVIDPETGFDAVADVAITGDRIVAVGHDLGAARQVIDATGLVVAPGFIDIHAHGQSVPADRMQAFDGVTTALELEVGALPVGAWYKRQAQVRRVLNYGTASAWIFARKAVMIGLELQDGEASLTVMGRGADDPRWSVQAANEAEANRIVALTRQGIEEGGLGIGIPNGYAPGAGAKEMSLICDLAAETDTPTYTHIAQMSNIDPKSSIEAYVNLIGLAAATGAHMHICHLNSTSLQDVDRAAKLIAKAQAQGLKITTEAYPYGTGSTIVSAGFFADPAFSQRTGTGYDAIELVTTHRRLRDIDDLLASREADPSALVLWHFLDTEDNAADRALLDISVLYPGGAIASDAMPWTQPDGGLYEGDEWPLGDDKTSHPRSSGTFTRFLRQWVHERQMLPLGEAIAKCSLIPARIVEPCAPLFRRKGRLQAGCDADIVIFDLEQVADRATFARMNLPSDGMRHVLVNGQPVISNGILDLNAAPGRAIRRGDR
ncbi:dihydroorotase [Phyllobacterium myrsinacearum]|uniref:amidohydrolase family protein n=1 Tax=Phyllobacterium myrsinacearum TaxID=28101 RepID=UPI001029926D|nr:amidohydrolase family protein [Phyllobacterium myrsinacearum]RZS79510.1 dihydroorotase [Phyllobacterium myrsinacearum]